MNRAQELNWMIPRTGEEIAGKYVVDGMCGRGGLAVVLSAMHVGLDQRVAIKMLLPEWQRDDEVVERFLREGRAATRIKSEHVVRTFDVGTLDNGAPYLVLEYLEGHNLDEVLVNWGPLPVPTAIDWVLQAVEAISEAHSYGIVHRDLKPANLFLTRRADGSACIKVIDFGLSKLTDPRMRGASARLTRPNDVMGSPHYMAPEQLRATCNTDARADLWAIGAVLHELLTGKPPFRAETMPALCATVLTQAPERLSTLRPSIPSAVEQAVLRCLEKEPEARFANAAELARAIAPFGTSAARTSCERIERTLESDKRVSDLSPMRVSDLSLLPPLAPMSYQAEDWPSTVGLPRPGPASARIVFGAFLMLAGLGVAAFMWLYVSVHGTLPTIGHEPRYAGVTAPQGLTTTPTPTPTPTTTTTATATATPTATATTTAAPIAAGVTTKAPLLRAAVSTRPKATPAYRPHVAPSPAAPAADTSFLAPPRHSSPPPAAPEPSPYDATHEPGTLTPTTPPPATATTPPPTPAPTTGPASTDDPFDGRK